MESTLGNGEDVGAMAIPEQHEHPHTCDPRPGTLMTLTSPRPRSPGSSHPPWAQTRIPHDTTALAPRLGALLVAQGGEGVGSGANSPGAPSMFKGSPLLREQVRHAPS